MVGEKARGMKLGPFQGMGQAGAGEDRDDTHHLPLD